MQWQSFPDLFLWMQKRLNNEYANKRLQRTRQSRAADPSRWASSYIGYDKSNDNNLKG